MKRLHTPLLAALVLIGACSASEPVSESSTTTTSLVVTTTTMVPPTTSVVPAPDTTGMLTVWAPGDAAPIVREAADRFSADTGASVDVVAMDSGTVLAAIIADPAAGPDVFIGPHDWLLDLTHAGIAEPVRPSSEAVAGAVAAVTLRDVVFATPLGLEAIVQFRNPALLPVPPNDVESLAAGCGQDNPDDPCLLIPVDAVDEHYPFLVALGGYLFGPDDFEVWDPQDVGVNSEAALAGIQILAALAGADITTGVGSSSTEARFIAGDAPLLWGGLDSLAELRESDTQFIVEDLPAIAGSPGRGPLRVIAAWVNAFSSEKQAASLLVETYLAQPEYADAIAVALGRAPVSVGFAGDDDLAPFVRAGIIGDPVPSVYSSPVAWEQLAVAFEAIRNEDDPAGALLAAAAEIRNTPPPEPPEPEEDA